MPLNDTAQALDDVGRHRPISEVRLTGGVRPLFTTQAHPIPAGALTDELRADIWTVIDGFLFAPAGVAGGEGETWSSVVTGRPAVRRVWSAPPLSGDPALIPEDIAELIEGWFSLVEACDVYSFAETVHDSLESGKQQGFATACNVALERGLSDHRFVLQRLVPIASRIDIAAIERALSVCSSAGATEAEDHLRSALARLAAKPEPDCRGAVQDAVRAVGSAAFVVTGERYLSLDDTLDDLKAKGLLGTALESAHRGLLAYVGSGARKATPDDARLIVVMCAGFLIDVLAKRRSAAP